MKVCNHKGYRIAVLTRDEHCPPHVHVGTKDWDARFLFTFWHDGVPSGTSILPIRRRAQEFWRSYDKCSSVVQNLTRARECWWISRSTLCLENQGWDTDADEVASVRLDRPAVCPILSASFDPLAYTTRIRLSGHARLMEIAL